MATASKTVKKSKPVKSVKKTTTGKTTAAHKTAEKLQKQIKLLRAKKQGIAEQIAAKQTALTAAKVAAKKA